MLLHSLLYSIDIILSFPVHPIPALIGLAHPIGIRVFHGWSSRGRSVVFECLLEDVAATLHNAGVVLWSFVRHVSGAGATGTEVLELGVPCEEGVVYLAGD
jgi:hypothetical protein